MTLISPPANLNKSSLALYQGSKQQLSRRFCRWNSLQRSGLVTAAASFVAASSAAFLPENSLLSEIIRLCYGKLEAGLLTFIIPSVLLRHLIGLMNDEAKLVFLGTWMALFVEFYGRKFTQPIKSLNQNFLARVLQLQPSSHLPEEP
ncbi:hypothetical protein DY000_02018001 [Brassica cretica]|uniref:Uncharacterized protein n=1 Tax=Brassica cretica TaxID=69181 RepID=A0ABQ7D284_BRACR|nr:hypothetical protein DY000_02018001 [Brassica cretica]